jgi:hypothetical protein
MERVQIHVDDLETVLESIQWIDNEYVDHE